MTYRRSWGPIAITMEAPQKTNAEVDPAAEGGRAAVYKQKRGVRRDILSYDRSCGTRGVRAAGGGDVLEDMRRACAGHVRGMQAARPSQRATMRRGRPDARAPTVVRRWGR